MITSEQKRTRERLRGLQDDLESELYIKVIKKSQELSQKLDRSFLPWIILSHAYLQTCRLENSIDAIKRALEIAPEVQQVKLLATIAFLRVNRGDLIRELYSPTPADDVEKLIQITTSVEQGDCGVSDILEETMRAIAPTWESIFLFIELTKRCSLLSLLDSYLSSLDTEKLGQLEIIEIARTYLYLGKYGKALSLISNLNVLSEQGSFILGEIWSAIGDHRKAARNFTWKIKESGIGAKVGMAISMKFLGREEADDLLKRAAKELKSLSSSDFKRNLLLGRVYKAQGRLEESIETLRLSISQASYDARPLILLGEIFWQEGKREHAINAFLEALELNPSLCEHGVTQKVESHFSRILLNNLIKLSEGTSVHLSILQQRVLNGRITPKWTENLLLRLGEAKALPGSYDMKTHTFIKEDISFAWSGKRCRHCQEDLFVNAKFCAFCGLKVDICNVCRRQITLEDHQVAQCPFCANKFHLSHIQEWLKLRGTCPICRRTVKGEILIPDLG